MLNKLIIALSSLAVGFVCISCIDIHDKAVSSDVNEKLDYVSLLLPYENALNDFNNTHGTSYRFLTNMTDEELNIRNINRDEYLEEMVNTYADMTMEEFESVLEQAYKNDISETLPYSQKETEEELVCYNNDTLSAENLPYYQKETTEEELVTVFVDSNNNIIHKLKK